MELKIGTARECITPEIGGLLMGYGSSVPSDSVHDGLNATAIALEYGQEKVILLSLDLCLIENDLTAELREACGRAANIPAANVLLATTHTHSGPNFDGSGDGGYVDNILMPRLISAAGNCVKNMRPATVGIAKANTLTGINRRELLADNSVILGQNPWGPYDPEMTVISFKGADGKIIANIVHCTAHNTGSGINTEISRDWCGVMVDRLEKESGAVTAFFNGCAGDVAPRIPNGGSDGGENGGQIALALELGSLAGIDAVRTYRDIREFREMDLAVVNGEIRIPFEEIKPLTTARAEFAKYKDTEGWFGEYIRRILTEVIEMHERGDTGPKDFVIEQTLVRLGPVVFVPIPFEPFTELSLRLRKYSAYGHTLAVGYCNGSNSYLPTEDQIVRGGYEIDCFHWGMARQLPPDTDSRVINGNLKIMEKF